MASPYQDAANARLVRHCCAAVLVVATMASAESIALAASPNVVVFLADDAGWGDYGHSGNRHAATPHIDALAAAGVSLDRFFVCPVCSPTRAEFLTGRYHQRGGVHGTSLGQERLDLDEATIAQAFQAAGYATGAFGKWHNGSQWPYHPQAPAGSTRTLATVRGTGANISRRHWSATER